MSGPFRRVRKPCTSPYGCTTRVQTLAYVAAPLCRACRRRLKNLRQTAAHQQHVRWETADQRRGYWRDYKRQQAAERKAA
jgi:hypothetical protein